MLDKSNNDVTWYCDNCGRDLSVGYKAYRLPDGTVLCDAICVEDYAFMHAFMDNDNINEDEDESDILADIWDVVETSIIPQ